LLDDSLGVCKRRAHPIKDLEEIPIRPWGLAARAVLN
jgi:hypothetical protein